MKIHTITVEGVTLQFDLYDKPGDIRRNGNQIVQDAVQEINRILANGNLERNAKIVTSKGIKITAEAHEL